MKRGKYAMKCIINHAITMLVKYILHDAVCFYLSGSALKIFRLLY